MELMWKVCLAVNCAVINTLVLAQRPCNEIQAAIVGRAQKTFLEGRVTICNGTELRAVCRDGWDLNDARVLCRELGYPTTPEIQPCGNFCNGGEQNILGATNFTCSGDEDSLIQCNHTLLIHGGRCTEFVAVKCYAATVTPCSQECSSQDVSTLPRTCPTVASTSSCPEVSTCPQSEACEGNSNSMMDGYECRSKCTTIIASILGAVSFILLLALVGVVIGWVWSCRKKKPTISSQCAPKQNKIVPTRDTTLSNPTYGEATPTQPSSHLGPHDTPTSHTPSQGDRDYQEIDQEEEGVYHAVGEEGEEEEESGTPYEVPVHTKK